MVSELPPEVLAQINANIAALQAQPGAVAPRMSELDPSLRSFIEGRALQQGAPNATFAPPQFTPGALDQIRQSFATAGSSPLFNAAGGFSPLQGGTLNPLDPLYNYAKTAPVLSLRGNRDFETLNFQALPGTNYRLTVGGEVIGSASTPEEVARLVQAANRISERGGAQVDVRLQQEIQTANPDGTPATAFNDVYANRENNTGALGTILPAGLALVSAGTLAPVLGPALGIGKAAATGIAAGLGSTAGSLGTGSSIEDALVKGAIAGVTAGGLQAAGIGGLGGAKSSVAANKASGLVDSAIAPGLKVPAFVGPDFTLSQLGLDQIAGVGGSALADAAEPMITVAGNRIVGGGLGSAAAEAIGGGIGSIGADLVQPSAFDQAMELARIQNQYDAPRMEDDFINVAGQRIPQPAITPAIAAPAAAATALAANQALSQAGQQAMQSETTTSQRVEQQPQESKTKTASKSPAAKAIKTANTIRGGISLAAGLGNALGLFGGGGDSGAGGIGGMGGGFNELVAVLPYNRTRNPATFDPFTYGQTGGQFRFFGDERPQFQIGIGGPMSPAPTVPGPDAGIVPDDRRFNKGGPIRGIGGGQEDTVPAMLSDGEYVFSAQDVADLGDGNTMSGFEKLDKMRQLIRKQAGRKNTKTIAKPQKSVSSLLRAV